MRHGTARHGLAGEGKEEGWEQSGLVRSSSKQAFWTLDEQDGRYESRDEGRVKMKSSRGHRLGMCAVAGCCALVALSCSPCVEGWSTTGCSVWLSVGCKGCGMPRGKARMWQQPL